MIYINKEEIFLESEVSELKKFLASTPEDNIIERASLQYRLEQVENELKELREKKPKKILTIIFNKNPNNYSEDIQLDFVGNAMIKFSEIFTTLIKSTQEIAYKNITEANLKLSIADTIFGPRGFEIEMIEPELLDESNNDVARIAMHKLEKILKQTINGDDEEFAESLDSIDIEMINKIFRFFELLENNKFIFKPKSNSQTIMCATNEKIIRVLNRLNSDNIIDSDSTFEGNFDEILPTSKSFEFITKDGISISEKIARNITNAYEISKKFLFIDVTINLSRRDIGRIKPRYMLTKSEEINLLYKEQ